MKIHFVKAGETLYEIGIKYGVTIEELVAANKTIIDPNLIMAGMKLIIPAKQMQTPGQTPIQTIEQSAIHVPVQTPVQTQTHAPILADSTAPSIPQYPVNQNMSAQMPTQNMAAQMPAQNMPAQMPVQNMPANIQQAQTNQYPTQLPGYPGQAIPPFAAIPVPAQPVIAPFTMNTIPSWSMPTEYTTYNTPYHMTNYTMPNPPSPNPNLAYQGMAQANGNYQPYPVSMMPNPSNENYEYYNTYAALQNNAAWPNHNPQPHAQMYQAQLTQENSQLQPSDQEEANVEHAAQEEKKKARTSAQSKGNGTVRTKKSTLHDQVIRLQQTRHRR